MRVPFPYISFALLAANAKLSDKERSAKELTTTSVHPAVTQEWFTNNKCRFYQSYADTIFFCNQAEIYALPRDRSFTKMDILQNIYHPSAYGFNGKILKVFASAGDTDKIYFLDSRTQPDTLVQQNMTLELSNQESFTKIITKDGSTSKTKSKVAQIRPVFDLASGLEADQILFSGDNTWFAFIRTGDAFLALMEVDLKS